MVCCEARGKELGRNVSVNNPLISVVDDDTSMSRMLCRVIRSAGLEVLSFRSAEEFLNSNRTNDVACLILDINLPGISGIDLQQQLKDSGVAIPTIFISGKAPEDFQQNALTAGAVGFFRKPFSIESLLTTVRTVI